VLDTATLGNASCRNRLKGAEQESGHATVHLILSSYLGLYSDTSDTDVQTQEEDLYPFPCFPPAVSAFQLAAGNTAPFSLGICDSNETCVSFADGSETLQPAHPPKKLPLFSTTHQSFVRLHFAFAQQIHH